MNHKKELLRSLWVEGTRFWKGGLEGGCAAHFGGLGFRGLGV